MTAFAKITIYSMHKNIADKTYINSEYFLALEPNEYCFRRIMPTKQGRVVAHISNNLTCFLCSVLSV